MNPPHPIALAIVQSNAEDDLAVLDVLPGASRHVLHPADLAGVAVPRGVTAIVGQWGDREEAARLVWRTTRADLVVILTSDERPDAALVAALRALAADPQPGTYRARLRHRFLGREISGESVPLAWCGETPDIGVSRLLDGTLVRIGTDVATTIARLDAETTRIAASAIGPRLVEATPRSIGDATAPLADLVARPAGALLRRFWGRRRDGVPGVILSLIESYGEVLSAAKRWERRALLEQHLVAPSGLSMPTGFVTVKTPAGWMVVRRDVDERLLGSLLEVTPDNVAGVPVSGGGRGGAWMLALENGRRAVLRWYRRGGALRRVLHDRYFGWRPRPLLELVVTEEARRRGVATAEVLGARVDRLRFGFYRGVIVTRAIDRALTLGEALERSGGAGEREVMLRAVAAAIRLMHERGVHHRDLNVANVLLVLGDPPTVHLIDFDRAQLRAMPSHVRRRALRRLDRSLVKLNREREVISAAERTALERAYWEST